MLATRARHEVHTWPCNCATVSDRHFRKSQLKPEFITVCRVTSEAKWTFSRVKTAIKRLRLKHVIGFYFGPFIFASAHMLSPQRSNEVVTVMLECPACLQHFCAFCSRPVLAASTTGAAICVPRQSLAACNDSDDWSVIRDALKKHSRPRTTSFSCRIATCSSKNRATAAVVRPRSQAFSDFRKLFA